jgi:hypothetical protein
MGLTNAQRQARWRDKRNDEAQLLHGKPNEIANRILLDLGPKEAARILRALDKRLRNIKPDCPACHGTGFLRFGLESTCGARTVTEAVRIHHPCDCG